MELREKLEKLRYFYEGLMLDEHTSEENQMYYSGCVRTIELILKTIDGDSSDIDMLISDEFEEE